MAGKPGGSVVGGPVSATQPQKLIIMTSRSPATQHQSVMGVESGSGVTLNKPPLGAPDGTLLTAPPTLGSGATSGLPHGAKFVVVKTEPKDDDYSM